MAARKFKARRECANCKTSKTPFWRRSPNKEFLCNACGLYLRTHHVNRPVDLVAASSVRTQSTAPKPSVAYPNGYAMHMGGDIAYYGGIPYCNAMYPFGYPPAPIGHPYLPFMMGPRDPVAGYHPFKAWSLPLQVDNGAHMNEATQRRMQMLDAALSNALRERQIATGVADAQTASRGRSVNQQVDRNLKMKENMTDSPISFVCDGCAAPVASNSERGSPVKKETGAKALGCAKTVIKDSRAAIKNMKVEAGAFRQDQSGCGSCSTTTATDEQSQRRSSIDPSTDSHSIPADGAFGSCDGTPGGCIHGVTDGECSTCTLMAIHRLVSLIN